MATDQKIITGTTIRRSIIGAFAFLLGFGACLLFADKARAASLSLNPATGTYSVGQSFTVAVTVESTDQSMNAASGVLSFPTNKLQISGVSKSGSIVSFWSEEPSFSNSAGTASFEGLVLNPGYQGSYGKLITFTFQTKASGSAKITFSSASVLANDGQGSNILIGSAGMNLTILPATAPSPNSAPATTPQPAPPASRTPNDSMPPEQFSITRIDTDPRNPQPLLAFATTDKLSGLAGYRMKIGDGDWFDAAEIAAANGTYRLPLQGPGTHLVMVSALDHAGNARTAELAVTVMPVNPPQVLHFAVTIDSHQPFFADGLALPNSKVNLTLRNNSHTHLFSANADKEGRWAATLNDPLPRGDYEFLAQTVDPVGALSFEATNGPVTVRSWDGKAIGVIGEYTFVALVTIFALALIVAAALFAGNRITALRRRLAGELSIFEAKLEHDEARLSHDTQTPDRVVDDVDAIREDIDSEMDRLKKM